MKTSWSLALLLFGAAVTAAAQDPVRLDPKHYQVLFEDAQIRVLAASPKLPKTSDLYTSNPLPPSGVVDLNGPADLKAILPEQQSICGTPVITNLLGGSPEEQPERYRAASPIELLPFGVRQEFFAGRMTAAHAAPYETATKQAGDVLHATVLPTAGHFVFIDPQSDVWPEVIAAVRRLLSKPD